VVQTTLEDQEVFVRLRERCQDSILELCVHQRAYNNYFQGAKNQRLASYFIANTFGTGCLQK